MTTSRKFLLVSGYFRESDVKSDVRTPEILMKITKAFYSTQIKAEKTNVCEGYTSNRHQLSLQSEHYFEPELLNFGIAEILPFSNTNESNFIEFIIDIKINGFKYTKKQISQVLTDKQIEKKLTIFQRQQILQVWSTLSKCNRLPTLDLLKIINNPNITISEINLQNMINVLQNSKQNYINKKMFLVIISRKMIEKFIIYLDLPMQKAPDFGQPLDIIMDLGYTIRPTESFTKKLQYSIGLEKLYGPKSVCSVGLNAFCDIQILLGKYDVVEKKYKITLDLILHFIPLLNSNKDCQLKMKNKINIAARNWNFEKINVIKYNNKKKWISKTFSINNSKTNIFCSQLEINRNKLLSLIIYMKIY